MKCMILFSGMFDRDFSGTIDLNEFQALWSYIHQWKGVFDRYDNNRSGSIESQELQRGMELLGESFSSIIQY